MKVSLILACAGKGLRAGFGKNKLWKEINGMPVFERALAAFYGSGLIDQYIITANEEDFDKIEKLCGNYCEVVKGGATRTLSVKNALGFVTGDVVLIHDGARPFVSSRLIKDCIAAAVKYGGAVPALPVRDTVMKRDGERAEAYIGKDGLCIVQTPQAFKTELIKKAYSLAGEKTFNDDGEVYKNFAGELFIVEGDPENVKLTYPEDFAAKRAGKVTRFGTGFDCHRLGENRRLVLGGVEIPFDKGLIGHSDADVLTHAIMDAMLSAAALRDIGYHFSDKDPKYKDADSMKLLEKVVLMIAGKGYKVNSVSATVMAEKPKLLPFIPKIAASLAAALKIPADNVGIAATTLEGLGFVGREEGICVHATATLENND